MLGRVFCCGMVLVVGCLASVQVGGACLFFFGHLASFAVCSEVAFYLVFVFVVDGSCFEDCFVFSSVLSPVFLRVFGCVFFFVFVVC